MAELLDLPDDVTQICSFPVADTKGVDVSPSPRRHPARDVIGETDMKVRPDVVRAAIANSELAELRVEVEEFPGGARIRVHAPAETRRLPVAPNSKGSSRASSARCPAGLIRLGRAHVPGDEAVEGRVGA